MQLAGRIAQSGRCAYSNRYLRFAEDSQIIGIRQHSEVPCPGRLTAALACQRTRLACLPKRLAGTQQVSSRAYHFTRRTRAMTIIADKQRTEYATRTSTKQQNRRERGVPRFFDDGPGFTNGSKQECQSLDGVGSPGRRAQFDSVLSSCADWPPIKSYSQSNYGGFTLIDVYADCPIEEHLFQRFSLPPICPIEINFFIGYWKLYIKKYSVKLAYMRFYLVHLHDLGKI